MNNDKMKDIREVIIQSGETPEVVIEPKANYIRREFADDETTKGETPDVIIEK